MNLIDFGGKKNNSGQGSVRVSVLEAFDPLLIEQSSPGEWFMSHYSFHCVNLNQVLTVSSFSAYT